MASWIVHLRLAERLLEQIDGLNPEQFGIGNIAPDSGIPDENWETFDPPTKVTHFQPDKIGDSFRSEDLRFYREYLQGLPWPDGEPKKFSFLLGYFFHLITDNLWWFNVGQPTKTKFAAQFEADDKFIWMVKKDWYGLDFRYVRANPECFFWRVFLESEVDRQYLDFLPVEAVKRNVAHIKDYYQRRDEKIEAMIDHEYIYMTKADMDAFIEDSTQILLEVYRTIWEQRVDTAGKVSALELMGDD